MKEDGDLKIYEYTLLPKATVVQHTHPDSQVASQPFGIIPTSLFVIVISFVSGLYSIATLGLLMYQKQNLNISSQVLQLMAGLKEMPWVLKPVFGFALDNALRKIGKTKYILFFTSVVKFVVYFVLSQYNLTFFWLMLILLINETASVFESIIAEYCFCLLYTSPSPRDS